MHAGKYQRHFPHRHEGLLASSKYDISSSYLYGEINENNAETYSSFYASPLRSIDWTIKPFIALFLPFNAVDIACNLGARQKKMYSYLTMCADVQ